MYPFISPLAMIFNVTKRDMYRARIKLYEKRRLMLTCIRRQTQRFQNRGFRGLKMSPLYEQTETQCISPSTLDRSPCPSFRSAILLVLPDHLFRNHQLCLTGVLLCPFTVVNSCKQYFWIFPETVNVPLLFHTLQRIFD